MFGYLDLDYVLLIITIKSDVKTAKKQQII